MIVCVAAQVLPEVESYQGYIGCIGLFYNARGKLKSEWEFHYTLKWCFKETDSIHNKKEIFNYLV